MKQRSHPASMTMSICALALCGAWLTHPVQGEAAQAQQATAREQGAATQQQSRKTDGANRAAAVADETSAAAAQAARTAQSEAAQFEAQARRSGSNSNSGNSSSAPSYGPTLAPRAQQAQDPARKDPAEVHDETDSLTRPAPGAPQADPAQSQRQTTNPNLRRPAWQPAAEPMAPRPLRSAASVAGPADDAVVGALPVPAPSTPPPAQVPGRAIIGSCQGNSCLDTNGQRYNGIGTGAAGVNSSGRLCTRTGISVQCF